MTRTLAETAISVLDLAKVSQNQSISETFQHSKELARHVEKLGYTRYWLAEHHNIEGIASAATSVLIGYIAEQTTSIRVGSGGIMLPNHSSLVIAEQFGTLATLYPNRIDLGLGRAPGTDPQTMRALRRDHLTQRLDFGDMVQELQHYFAPPEENQKIKAIPGAGIDVPLYILGSSLYSADLASRLGLPYAFAGHFAPAQMMAAFDLYRHRFEPSRVLKEPYIMVGVPVVAAASDEEADYLATSIQQAFLGLVRGSRKLSSPPVKNMDAIWSPVEKQSVQSMLGMLVTGGPERVRKKLDQVIEITNANELIITSDTFEHKDRLNSFEFIAKAKNLR